MQLKSSEKCRLAIGSYPFFEYNATGGGGEAILIDSNEAGTKLIKFCTQNFQIPSLNWKTTKFLNLPLPPGINIDMSMEKLEGTIHQISGEIKLDLKARFNLQLFSIIKFPDLIVESLLNTGKVSTKSRASEGSRIKRNGQALLVGTARVKKTKNIFLDSLLFLPTDAIAELRCEISW
tara:strand:+ start:3240 stop:3773 length:534 start_codon:yes stop_codon:yes gene_type:complete